MTNSSLVGIARHEPPAGSYLYTGCSMPQSMAWQQPWRSLPLLQVNYYTHTYLLDISVCTCKETRICDTADSMVPEALTCQAVECLANWLAVQPVMAANSSDDVLSLQSVPLWCRRIWPSCLWIKGEAVESATRYLDDFGSSWEPPAFKKLLIRISASCPVRLCIIRKLPRVSVAAVPELSLIVPIRYAPLATLASGSAVHGGAA